MSLEGMNLDEYLNKLEVLEKAATPGPWYSVSPEVAEHSFYSFWDDKTWKSDGSTISPDPKKAGWETDGGCEGYSLSKNNTDLIAESRNAIPILLQIIRLQKDLIDQNDAGWWGAKKLNAEIQELITK